MAVPLQDWKEKSLGDLLEFKNGFNADASQYGLGIPFASVLDALQSTPMTEKTIKGKVQVQLLTVFPFCLKKGDLVFMRSSETLEEVGWSNVYNGKDWQALFGGFVIRGRPKVEVDSVFLNYLLRLPQYRERVINEGAGAVHYNIGQRGLARVKIPLPPLPEQHRIAEKLGTVDNLIDNLTRRIEKKRQVKQGVMQELLTGKKRLPGFAGEWKRVLLQDVGVLQKGHGISRADSHSGSIPAVRYGEIYTHHNDYVRKYNSFISEQAAAKAVALHRGDIVFAGSGETAEEIGKAVAIVDEGVYVGGDTIIFSPRDPVAPIFWGYLLNMPYVQHQKTLAAHGATIIHIRPEAIAALRICIPETPEQSAIATVLATMDASIAKLEAKRAKCEDIKRGLMHDLLTGKVRV